MTLADATIALAGIGALSFAVLAVLYMRDAAEGLSFSGHRMEKLPEVMTDRYVAFALLTLFAALYGDLAVIAALFGVFAFMGLADAWIYARGGFGYAKHLAAGASAIFVMGLAVLALIVSGENLT
ncbi:hypothetical protein [Roseovarius aestuariivivens]|uniref:hypothetical protein n=1 Tax=Roseovarius aestuariivivens TaxID=1888910 RepID=UPI001081BD9A|nr:hypothetical protein [Roseovarius aestuariivivens]